MENTNAVLNTVYSQRELFMNQMQLLFKDTPGSEKVDLFEEVFKLLNEERNAVKKVHETYVGEKETLEELYIMSSYNDKLNTLLQEKIALRRRDENTYSEDGLPSNVLK